MSWIRTNPSKAVPALLKRVKNSIRVDDDVPLANEIKQTIDDLLHQFSQFDKWNDELLECFLQLDRHRSFDGQCYKEHLNKIEQSLLILTNLTKDVLALLQRVKNSIRAGDDVPLANEIKQTIDDLLHQFSQVDKWNDELLEYILELDRHCLKTHGSFDGQCYKENLSKVQQSLLIRTNPSKVVTALLKRVKNSIIACDDVPSANEIKQTIDNLLHLFSQVDKWNDELLECFVELDRHHPATHGSFNGQCYKQNLNKIQQSLLILTNTSKDVPALLKRIKNSIRANDDVPSANEIKQTINDMLYQFSQVDKWNNELLECFLELDGHHPTTHGSFDIQCYKQNLNKIQQSLLILTNPSKALPTLLKRIKNSIRAGDDVPLANEIKQTIDDLLHQFSQVDKWNDELLECFLELDGYLPTTHRSFDGQCYKQDLNKIQQSLHKLKTDDKHGDTDPPGLPGRKQRDNNGTAYQNKENRLRALSSLEQRIVKHAENPIVKSLRLSYDLLNRPDLKMCLLFLAIFPERAVLKKKLVIYWWIGEGLVGNGREGKEMFRELLRHDLIKPYKDECQKVSKFQIHPWIRYMLISVATMQKLLQLDNKGIPCFDPNHSLRACLISERTNLENELASASSSHLRTIYNVNGMSLKGKPETLARFKKLVVLQLGRWQAINVSPTDQIQIRGDSFLSGLKTQKHLKYLSLRGISRITKLPDSMKELVSLEILDLKACHNLETLPDDVSPLRKLTHLDVSECYMLESLPKGLHNLTSLQVLKGFIIGNSHKTPFRIEHLKTLTKLEQLGIHIVRGPYLPKDMKSLKDFAKNVKSLKISWGSVKDDDDRHTLTFPASLEELKLEGIPSFSRAEEWLRPSQLKNLKKLYIKGGKLKSLDHLKEEGDDDDEWKVQFLLLKYTDELKIDEKTVRRKFGRLKYVKKVKLTVLGETSKESSEFEWMPEGSSSI